MIDKLKQFWLKPNKHQRHINNAISYGLLIVAGILLLRYQSQMMHLVEWGDESETIVVTKMMAAGYRLYTEIYNNHGPLTFLPGFIVSKLGNYYIDAYRVPIIVLQWLSWIAIYFSPIFKDRLQRTFASIFAASVMVLFLPRYFGHTYLYQVLSGLLFVVVLVQYALPVYFGIQLSRFKLILMNGILYSIPFLAITNIPMVGLIALSTFRLKDWKDSLIGLVMGVMFNVGFLLLFGSWDGYIAYHFYLNAKVLYSGAGLSAFIKTIFDYYTQNIVHFLSIILIFIGVSKIFNNSKPEDYLRPFLLIPAMMSLVMRGGDLLSLSGLIYLYCLIGLSMVLFVADVEVTFADLFKQFHLIIFSILCFIVLYQPIEEDNFFYALPDYSEFSRIAQKITTPDEKVLALSFQSREYLLAERLPASAHFIYLSIQAKYNQMPYKDIYVSVAEDILKNRPKIITMDKWNIILDDSDIWDNYAADINEVVYQEYYQLRDTNIYIRKDVNLLDYDLDPTFGYELK